MFTALQDLNPRDLKKNYKNKKIRGSRRSNYIGNISQKDSIPVKMGFKK